MTAALSGRAKTERDRDQARDHRCSGAAPGSSQDFHDEG
jgi:hypothetical protein